MPLGSILVTINVDEFAESRVKVAAELAARFGATLTGVCACAIQPIVTDAMALGIAGVVEDRSDIEAQLQTAQEKFRALAEPIAKPLEWRSAIDFPAEYAALQARTADLVVTGPSRGSGPYREVDPADLIMLAGRPVLIVPTNVSHLAADRITIAWKDTREARRAVLDSLPLCERATEVTVAAVAEESESEASPTDDVVRYLRSHKINANSFHAKADGSTGTTILALAKDVSADLIVAGAYGHSRLREWIFGGVTRELLTKSPVCCLMSN